jgi:RimJ/RimL family protein N-acetyltransferase
VTHDRFAIVAPLTTERLVLREFTDRDEAAVHAYAGDPEVTRYTPWGPNTPEETREFLRRAAVDQTAVPRMDFGLAITLADGPDEALGAVGLHIRDEARETAEIGYCLRRDMWGRGLVAEAAQAVVDAGFRQLRLHRIWASCDARNAGSWRVMERIGLRREARLIQDRRIKGEWRDTLIYAILAEAWIARTASG